MQPRWRKYVREGFEIAPPLLTALCFVPMAEARKPQLPALAATPAALPMLSCLGGTTAKTSPFPCKLSCLCVSAQQQEESTSSGRCSPTKPSRWP